MQVRRRRRRSGRSDPRLRLILFAAAGAAGLISFILLIGRADDITPTQTLERIELPDAIKDGAP